MIPLNPSRFAISSEGRLQDSLLGRAGSTVMTCTMNASRDTSWVTVTVNCMYEGATE